MSCCAPFVPPFTGSGSGGGGGGAAGPYSPPEKWNINNVAADLTNEVVPALVSVNFDDIKMINDGSIVGIGWRWTDPITGGEATIIPTINGVAATLTGTSDSGTNPSGGEETQASGVDVYSAGDLLGFKLTTNAELTPDGTTNLEIWLIVEDS